MFSQPIWDPLGCKRLAFLCLAALTSMLVAGCQQSEAERAAERATVIAAVFATQTAVAKAAPAAMVEAPKPVPPTPTATATPSPTPTATATPALPSVAEIYQQLAPSVAYIINEASTGSGILLQDGYIVTNAHVIWPFDTARVVFADGTAYDDVPVVATDFLTDLAILGPIDTGLPAVELASGEDLIIGDEVYLVGYPGEGQQFPQPAISKGIISRMRQWQRLDITYFQSDAAIAGGQSGGMFVSPAGQVIGISGFSLADNFAVVASATDLRERIAQLMARDERGGVPVRPLLLDGVQRTHFYTPASIWDQRMYVYMASSRRDPVTVSAQSDSDVYLWVTDVLSEYLVYADDTSEGDEEGSFTPDFAAPYFVIAGPVTAPLDSISVSAGVRLAAFVDPDDGLTVAPGQTITGSIDFPGDIDYFLLELDRDSTVTITVDSVMIDAFLQIDATPDSYAVTAEDNNSGGGLFGTNARVTYTTRQAGQHIITVEDVAGIDVGGYVLEIIAPRDDFGE